MMYAIWAFTRALLTLLGGMYLLTIGYVAFILWWENR